MPFDVSTQRHLGSVHHLIAWSRLGDVSSNWLKPLVYGAVQAYEGKFEATELPFSTRICGKVFHLPHYLAVPLLNAEFLSQFHLRLILRPVLLGSSLRWALINLQRLLLTHQNVLWLYVTSYGTASIE